MILPADGGGITVGNSAALTVIPEGNNNIFYYHGELGKALQEGLYGNANYSLSNWSWKYYQGEVISYGPK